MRLDKYLKLARIIKQRPRAKQLCETGAVHVNNKPAKASYLVKTGDIIRVITGNREITAKVLTVPEKSVSKNDARELIESLGEKWLDDFE